MTASAVRIANCSGFYGDRLAAAREMVEGGEIDVLTGDYLAEITMFIMWKSAQRPGGHGYARTFLRQMEDVLGTCVDRGITVVTNAGGLDPSGVAEAVDAMAERLGLSVRVAYVEGDDLVGRIDELSAAGEPFAHLDDGRPFEAMDGPVATANVYLGAWPIVQALRDGADVVVCPRVTDASLAVGPAAFRHGWAPDAWDALAGAVVAGHVIECGTQATGGNFSFFTEIAGLEHPGFPIAEIAADGSSVVTKHPGTGGAVTVETVTAQLLYEIDGAAYLGPDVVTHFDTIRLEPAGPDRVGISGVRGSPPPSRLKVAMTASGGFRNRIGFLLSEPELEAKADLVRRTVAAATGGERRFDAYRVDLVRQSDPDVPGEPFTAAELTVTVQSRDPRRVGRAFSNVAAEMALASYPGLHLSAPPGDATELGSYWPTTVAAAHVVPVVVHRDGQRTYVPDDTPRTVGDVSEQRSEPPASALTEEGPWVECPLGLVVGTRSGDKGGNANLGVWVRDPRGYPWLERVLTAERLRELLPETAGLPIRRVRLPNLGSLNFIVAGLLGDGAGSNTRRDAQAKGLAERLRAQTFPVPQWLAEPHRGIPPGRAGDGLPAPRA